MKQNLESIVQRNLFLAEDVGPLERKVKPSEDSEGGSREESVDEQRKQNPQTRGSCHGMTCSKTTRQQGQRRYTLVLKWRRVPVTVGSDRSDPWVAHVPVENGESDELSKREPRTKTSICHSVLLPVFMFTL